MKKMLSLVLALAMLLSVAVAVAEPAKITVFHYMVEGDKADGLVQVQEAFKAANPEYAGMTVDVQPMGEGDVASSMITDVEAGADIFGFAQDQLTRLVAAGALEVVLDENAEIVKTENDAGAVAAAAAVFGIVKLFKGKKK